MEEGIGLAGILSLQKSPFPSLALIFCVRMDCWWMLRTAV